MDRYSMTGSHRGKAVIINNMTFDEVLTAEDRPASKKDALAMKTSLCKLGFKEGDIVMKDNLKKDEMIKLMMDEANNKDDSYDCFVCVLLTHGFHDIRDKGDERLIRDVIYGTDAPFHLCILVDLFKQSACPHLKGKPKIFIIGACRGGASSGAVAIKSEASACDSPGSASFAFPQPPCGDKTDAKGEKHVIGKPLIDSPEAHYVTPVYRDVILYHATQPYKLAFINETTGSHFINSLCNQIETMTQQAEKGQSIEFIKLLTKVNHDLAGFTSKVTDPKYGLLQGKKQMPRISSCLTKKLLFPL